jgi:hypothetical protein
LADSQTEQELSVRALELISDLCAMAALIEQHLLADDAPAARFDPRYQECNRTN